MKKYSSSWLCSDLDKPDTILVDLSQDISELLDYLAFPKKYRKDITAAIVLMGYGDYLAVWITESARYYDLSAWYHPLPFYRPVRWAKKNLPEYWLESNPYYHKELKG